MVKSLAFTSGKKEYSVHLGRKVFKDDLYGRVKHFVEKDGQTTRDEFSQTGSSQEAGYKGIKEKTMLNPEKSNNLPF